MSADLALQTEIYTRILAQLVIDNLSSIPVTASPRTDQALPYIKIGEVTQATDHPIGQEFQVQVDVYSALNGPHQVKGAQASIRTALHGITFDSSPHRFTAMRVEYTTAFLDVTDETWQGVQRIRVLAS